MAGAGLRGPGRSDADGLEGRQGKMGEKKGNFPRYSIAVPRF